MKAFILSLLLVILVAAAALAGINVNTAGTSELQELPGIGPAKAQAIVEYREQNGPFKQVDDLVQVKGIGPKLLNKIKDEVSVE